MTLGMGLGTTQRQNEVSEMLQIELDGYRKVTPEQVISMIEDKVDKYETFPNVFGDTKILMWCDGLVLCLTLHDEGLIDEKWIGQYSAWYKL